MEQDELFADMMIVEWFDDYSTKYKRRKMPVVNPY